MLTIRLDAQFFVWVLRSVFQKWGRASKRTSWQPGWVEWSGVLGSTSGVAWESHAMWVHVTGCWKPCGSVSALRRWMPTTRRLQSTTSKVTTAPRPRPWSLMNLAQPSPTLTADTPLRASGNIRNRKGHSLSIVMDVTSAQSSEPGQPVSCVKVAGISYVVTLTQNPKRVRTEFLLYMRGTQLRIHAECH